MNWLPSIVTTSLFSLILFLARNWLLTRLQGSITHEYAKKLETFRNQLELRSRELESLRNWVLSGAFARENVIHKRRIEAVEVLWDSIESLVPAKSVSSIMTHIQFDEAAGLAKTDPRVRDRFEVFGDNVDLKNLGYREAVKVRPFLSDLAWGLYSAYYAIVSHGVLRQQILQHGFPSRLILDEPVKRLVITVFPDMKSFIENQDVSALHGFLDSIEKELLQELRSIIEGENEDERNMERASKIIKASENLMTQDTEGQQMTKS